MKRSKLETCIDILSILTRQGPTRLTRIMHKANICHEFLEEYLDFLIGHGLVEKRSIGKRVTGYSITVDGINVLKCFRKLRRFFPEEDELKNRIPPVIASLH